MMVRLLMAIQLLANMALAGSATAGSPIVKVETNKGAIVIELDQTSAPISVSNFLSYINSGFYDGTVFHRVIPNFMIQGGGFTANMEQKTTRAPIVNESANGLVNKRGTVAMARTPDPNSATAQFFINLKDNSFLDKAMSQDGVGYCVFGKVVEGMKVVDAIAAVKTGTVGGYQDVPVQPVVIASVRVVAVGEPEVVPSADTNRNKPVATQQGRTIKIQMVRTAGVYMIPVKVNGLQEIDFVYDTGASETTVTADVVSTMIRQKTISRSDFLPGKTYVLADGSEVQSPRFVIRKLEIGGVVLSNVSASVTNASADPLLGQNVLRHFRSVSQDNAGVLTLELSR